MSQKTKNKSPAAEILDEISKDPDKSERVIAYAHAFSLSDRDCMSGKLLSEVCEVDERTWRNWVAGTSKMPKSAQRLLIVISTIWPKARNKKSGEHLGK